MPNDMTTVNIISSKAGKGASTEDNSGKATIGTGPYNFVKWVPGIGSIEASPNYFGEKAQYDKFV